MFYQKEVDKQLRFGDILKGYVVITPIIEKPIEESQIYTSFCNINVNLPRFSVVLSPCCSIGQGMICLAPLIGIRGAFFDNPYFAKDLTNINRRMEPSQTVAPHVWEGFPDEEKQKRLKEGFTYAFVDWFVYDENPLFPKYLIHRKNDNIETSYYMVDFRQIHQMKCDKIQKPEDAPIEFKCLQLSVEARTELRNKISYYYGRPPKEDIIALE